MAVLLTSILVLGLCFTFPLINSLKWVKSTGYRLRSTETANQFPVYTDVTLSQCAAQCYGDFACNGFNYHRALRQCEIVLVGFPIEVHGDSSEWELWLPDDCPTLNEKPDFTSTNYSLNLKGIPVLAGSVYCYVSDSGSISSYINLPTSDYSNFGISPVMYTTYSKFEFDADSLTVTYDSTQFAESPSGDSSRLHVGHAAFSTDCSALTDVQLRLSLAGTQFVLSEDNRVTYSPPSGLQEFSHQPQLVNVKIRDYCPEILLRDSFGKLSLQVTRP